MDNHANQFLDNAELALHNDILQIALDRGTTRAENFRALIDSTTS